MVALWVPKDRLPALLAALSYIHRCDFNKSDQDAIFYELTRTSLDNHLWFDYSFTGDETMAVRLCRDDDDTDIIHCEIDFPEAHQPAINMMIFFLENFELRYLG